MKKNLCTIKMNIPGVGLVTALVRHKYFGSGPERVNDDTPYKEIIMPQKVSLRIQYIQDVTRGMCQTSGECSLR